MQEIDSDGFRFTREDIWREGYYIDLWSLVHTLSGAIAGLTAFYAPFSFWVAFSLATVLFILWELIERFGGIAEEYFSNQVTDVLFGQLGFLLAYPAMFYIDAPAFHFLYVSVWVATLSLSASGWTAAVRAEQLKKKLKTEWLLERDQLQRTRAMLKAEWQAYKTRRKERKEKRKRRNGGGE